MIYPKKNRLIHWFMDQYIRWLIRKTFRKLDYEQLPINTARSVLLIANHFSIWDGLLLYQLNHQQFKKKFHVMILEETAKREPFLKYSGAFSVNKGSRSIMESIKYAAELLNNPGNLVLIFPQGKIQSNFTTRIIFEKGIGKIIQLAKSNFQTVFAVSFIETFKYKKPTASIYLKEYSAAMVVDEVENAYQRFYTDAQQLQAQISF